MLHEVYLSLGSNLDNREHYIQEAIEYLAAFSTVQKKSKIIETDPIEYRNQPRFLNCIILIQTSDEPLSLLHKIENIENVLGRKRTIRFGPRTIDIDIIFYDDLVFSSEKLIIPHPRMHERLFVLEPLLEINPNLMHPILKKTIRELIHQLNSSSR